MIGGCGRAVAASRLTRQEALDRYARALGGSPSSRQRIAAAQRWLIDGGPLTREGLTAWAERLLGEYKPTTVAWYLGCVMGLCKACRLTYPGVSVRLDLTPANVVTAGPQFVSRLVRSAIASAPPRQLGWLALSTIYGCRAGELVAWRREYLAGDRVWIQAEKDSRSRWYWCPPAVARALGRALWQPVDDTVVYDGWGELLAAAGQARHRGTAWHSIRHGLVRAMEDAGIPDAAARRFLRWRSGEDPRDRIRRLYVEQVTGELGEDGRVQAVGAEVGGLKDIDQEVWAKHPYLGLWTGQGGVGDGR